MSGSERSPSPQRSTTPPRDPTPPRSPYLPRSSSPPSRSPRSRVRSPSRSPPPQERLRSSLPRRSPSQDRSASRSQSRHSSLQPHSSGRRGSRHGSEQNVSRGSSGHSSTRSRSSERAMSDHHGGGGSASRGPSQHSLSGCSASPSRPPSRSQSSERIRNEHNETDINNEHNEVHNNHEHRETHDSHNDHHTTSTTNMNNTYMTPEGLGFTNPISPYRSYRYTQHQNTCYPEDKLFPGLLSYSSASRKSSDPFRSYKRDDYYPNNRSGYYERRQRSGLFLSNSGSADIGALGLAAGALGGFLGGNALNHNNCGVVERPVPSAPRTSTGNYTNYSERPYVSRYSQEEAREDIGRREQRRRNAPVDGRSWLVDERRGENWDSERSNRESRPSERGFGRSNRDPKPPAERLDWDHYPPSTSGTENTPPIRYQGDSIDLGRGFAHDNTYATSHPVGGPAREYRADGTIKEATVNPYETPSRKPSKRSSGNKGKRESKSHNKTESSSSKMSGGYGIPLDRLIAPSGVILEPSTGRIPPHIKSGRAVNTSGSEAPMPSAPACGGSGLGIDRLETWQDYIEPQGRATAGVGGVGGMDGMGERMPEGVRLEKRPSRIGAFMGKLCGSARA